MCGIIGYIGERDGVEIVLGGLHKLEYRGYDSAGIAAIHNGALFAVKRPGKLAVLDQALNGSGIRGRLAIGHTRWATHGEPSEANAHPHFDAAGEIAVVHNGIIENYLELRVQLGAEGVQFRSDTDSETLAHLVRKHYTGDLFEAVKHALREVRGAYALGVICLKNPDVLVAARSGSPLIVGLGDGEAFIASDVPAIMNHTRRVVYLRNGQVCEVRRDGFRVEDLEGRPQAAAIETVNWDEAAAEKDGYPHFMLKEIHQQPDVIRRTLEGRVVAGSDEVVLDGLNVGADELRRCRKVVIVACGTAWHAGLVGKRLIETYARVPVEIDIASEYRYRDPIVPPDTLVIPVSQSGETADTLEAMRLARDRGARVVSVVNVVGSSVARESDGVIYTQAGPEIGVASTKAYTAQLAAFVLFAVHLGRLRGALAPEAARELLRRLREVPDKMRWCLDHQEIIKACASDPKYRDPRSAFYMGRGYNYPSALEGALKLKEISYIHAEGYAAGEMKHGPIALITDEVPMIGIVTRGAVYEKIVSNIQEIRARKGIVLSIATTGDDEVRKHSDNVIYVPDCHEALSPLVVAVPLQLLAYHIAVNRGCDVDQPRNLAKSVTVE